MPEVRSVARAYAVPLLRDRRPRSPAVRRSEDSARGWKTSRTVSFSTRRPELYKFEVPPGKSMRHYYAKDKAGKAAVPVIMDGGVSPHSSFDGCLARRDALELQAEVLGSTIKDEQWPTLDMDGYRAVFEARSDGPSHFEVPGPPTWVKLEGADRKSDVGYASAATHECPHGYWTRARAFTPLVGRRHSERGQPPSEMLTRLKSRRHTALLPVVSRCIYACTNSKFGCGLVSLTSRQSSCLWEASAKELGFGVHWKGKASVPILALPKDQCMRGMAVTLEVQCGCPVVA